MNNLIDYISNMTLDDVIIIAIAILIALIFNIFSSLISKIIIRIINGKNINKSNIKIKDNYLFKPLIWYLKIIGIYLAILYIKPNKEALDIVHKIFKMCTVLFICKSLTSYLRSSTSVLNKISSKFKKDNKISTLIINIIVFLIYFIGVALILSEIGYDISSLITGLGISGVIIALAAQDTAKNLFGGMIIIFDKPFAIGDWIQTSSEEGIVEDLTFRSTRIRTFKDSLITIPNSTITNDSVINWSRMNKRRTDINLQLVFDTKLKNVYSIIDEIKKMLIEDETVLNEKIAVHFTDINANGYNVFISYFTNITGYYDYLKIKENINYKIMQILEKNKITLAYNSLDLYIKK